MYYPGIATTIKTMGVNTTTIAYLRVLIIEIGSTIILMVVEAQGIYIRIDTLQPITVRYDIYIYSLPFSKNCHGLLLMIKPDAQLSYVGNQLILEFMEVIFLAS